MPPCQGWSRPFFLGWWDYFPSSLTLRYRWQGPRSRQVFVPHLPIRQGPGFVSCPPVSVFQGRGSVSPSSAETVQVKAGFCVWATHLFSLCFETCKISYFAATSVTHLKLIFVFIQHNAFQLGKVLGIPNLLQPELEAASMTSANPLPYFCCHFTVLLSTGPGSRILRH